MVSRRWQRSFHGLACAALAAVLMAPLTARADGSDKPPNGNDRVIIIGPQAVVVENERGQLRMYDDPAQRAPGCGSSLACLGQVLGVYGVAAYLTLDNLTVIGFKGERFTPPRLGSPPE
jgi:hypothetical protein